MLVLYAGIMYSRALAILGILGLVLRFNLQNVATAQAESFDGAYLVGFILFIFLNMLKCLINYGQITKKCADFHHIANVRKLINK